MTSEAKKEYDTLHLTTVAPHVLLITLNRPESSNALNTQMGRDLLAFFDDLTQDPGDTRCVAVLSFDVDGVSGAINRNPDTARYPSTMSMREYGGQDLVAGDLRIPATHDARNVGSTRYREILVETK